MKKNCSAITIAVFLLFLLNGVPAQSQQTELNQVELNSQLVGSWEFEYGNDTTYFMDFTTYGTGIDANLKIVAKGVIIMEQRVNWAYDKTGNKMIGLAQMKEGDCALMGAHWISKNKYVVFNYEDISNPEMAPWKNEGTFKSPELLEVTEYISNKPVNTLTYTRVK